MPSVQRVRWAKVRVISVGVAALLILGTFLSLLTGGTLFQPRAALYVYMPDATGLALGSPVRVDGIFIGTVQSIELSGSTDPNRIIRVKTDVQLSGLDAIPTDSYAELSSETLIGDKYVDITSGHERARIRPGAEIPFKGDVLKNLDLSQFETQLRTVDATLTEIETGRSRVGQFILNRDMYDDLRRYLKDTQDLAHNLGKTPGTVPNEVYTDRLYRSISQPLKDFDQMLARIQSGQGPMGQLMTDTATYDQFVASAKSLTSSMRDFHGSDFMQSGDLYDGWVRTVNSWSRMVDDFNASPMILTSADYDNFAGMAKEVNRTMKDFRENPRKYLRLKIF